MFRELDEVWEVNFVIFNNLTKFKLIKTCSDFINFHEYAPNRVKYAFWNEKPTVSSANILDVSFISVS